MATDSHEDVARLNTEIRRLRAQVQQQIAEIRRLESQVLVERAAKGVLEAQLEKYYRHIGSECLGNKVAEQHVENGASDIQSRANNPSHTLSSDERFKENGNGGSRKNGETQMNGRGTTSAIVTVMPGEKDIKVQIKEESQPFVLVTNPSNDDEHDLGTSEQVPFGSQPCNNLPGNAYSASAINSESIIRREETERVISPQHDLPQPNTIAQADPQSAQDQLDDIALALQPPDDQLENESVTVCASLQAFDTEVVKDNEQRHPTPARSVECANQTDDVPRIPGNDLRCITASPLPVAECGTSAAIPARVSSEPQGGAASHEANWQANVARPPNLLPPELLQIMRSRISDMTPFPFKQSKSSARYVSMRKLQEVCGRVSGRVLETEFTEPKLRDYTRIFIADVESSPFLPLIPGAWGLFLRVELDGITVSTATPGEHEVLAVRVGPKHYNIMGEYEFNSSHSLNIREIQLLPEKCKESLLDEFRRGILHVGSNEPSNLLNEKAMKAFELGILKVLVWTMKFIRYNWSFKKRLLASKEPKPIAPKNNTILTQYFSSTKPGTTLSHRPIKPCQPLSSEPLEACLTDTCAAMNVDEATASTSEVHTYRDPSNSKGVVKGRRKRGPPGIRANDALALQQAFGAEAEQGVFEALETASKRRRRISSDDESYKESDSDWLSSDNDVRAVGRRRRRRKVEIMAV